MGIGQWKPQELSTLSEKFYENQDVSFMYRKTLIVGKIEKLLVNSAIVSLPANFSEKTVVSYKHLSIK